jgi:glycosyltransferase involved in cell wall biosynthesis
MSKKPTILLHLPAYRDPELIPTIEDALEKAKYPKRVHFGICRQYHPEDGFDDLTKYKKDKRFKIYECLYTEAKGLPWARSIINEQLLDDEDYVCQLDSHHRFAEDWDETLIQMHLCQGSYVDILTSQDQNGQEK